MTIFLKRIVRITGYYTSLKKYPKKHYDTISQNFITEKEINKDSDIILNNF